MVVHHCQSRNITIKEILKLLELNPFILNKNDDNQEEYLIEIQTREDKNHEATAMIYFIINKTDRAISLKPHFLSYSKGEKLCEELNDKHNFQNTLLGIIEKNQMHWDTSKDHDNDNANEVRLKFSSETPLTIDTESGSQNNSSPKNIVTFNRDHTEEKFHYQQIQIAHD